MGNYGTPLANAGGDPLSVSTCGIMKEGWILTAPQAKGRVPGRFWTGVEMLVEPTVRGAENAAGLLVKFYDFILSPRLVRMYSQVLRPHQEVA